MLYLDDDDEIQSHQHDHSRQLDQTQDEGEEERQVNIKTYKFKTPQFIVRLFLYSSRPLEKTDEHLLQKEQARGKAEHPTERHAQVDSGADSSSQEDEVGGARLQALSAAFDLRRRFEVQAVEAEEPR